MELRDLRNLNQAMLIDLAMIGINSVDDLRQADATELYHRLNERSGSRKDPCVWDILAAAIHQANTGEALDWTQFTPQRKELIKQGKRL